MPTPNNPLDLWLSQTEEETKMSLEEIRQKAQAFQQKIRRRNIREYISIVFGTIPYCGVTWYLDHPVIRVGAVLTLIGMYYSVYQIYRDGSAQEVPADGECLGFHRRELTKQRDMLRRVGPCHIGPIIPGMLLFYAGAWLSKVDDQRSAIIMSISGLLALSVFAFVYWLNVRAATKLQHELDALG
jgi:hypothetical protein